MGARPEAVLRRLAGPAAGDPLGTRESHVLATADDDGWPRLTHLSDGEVLAMADGSVRLCTWKSSRTAGNLRRDGRATLTVAAEGAAWEVRLRCRERPAPPGAPDLAYFVAEPESAEEHRAKYASVERGTAFRLHDPAEAEARWSAQHAALRSLT
jgi:hypothetical protein